jgi:adenosylcobinamide kinase/adenosylcobinamide-phosphate guanylyltransferase
MSTIILVTGGARSGKSSYALELAESLSDNRLFVATCPTIDDEMNMRILRHQRERAGRGWKTLEIESDLAAVLKKNCSDYKVILVDCITLWINNLLFAGEHQSRDINDQYLVGLIDEWIDIVRQSPVTLICVTNEVGLGIIPDNPVARKYRDLVGSANQAIAAAADEVTLISCGLPLSLK